MGDCFKYKVLEKQIYTSGEYSIVPIRIEDRYLIMQWRNEQIYHLRQNKSLTKEDQDCYFEHAVVKLFDQEKPDQILFSFLIGNQCIGYGGLVHINWIDSNAEISFIIDTSLESKYFNTHWRLFLRLIEMVGFVELGLHKIFTYAYDIRPELFKALESFGYSKEATLQQHVNIENDFKDVIIHSKIRTHPWLRNADVFDTDITYKWATDPKIRQYAFNKDSISFQNHKKWFEDKVSNENCLYLIFEDGMKKIGTIRFDLEDENATVSYLIDSSLHGKGYGTLIIEVGLTKLQSLLKKPFTVIGYVKSENNGSIRIFEKLNFKLIENINDTLKFEKK